MGGSQTPHAVHTPRNYLVNKNEPPPHIIARPAGNPLSTGNPLSRENSQRQSARRQHHSGPAQLPPMPPQASPQIRHLPAGRFPGHDIMNPTEVTHVSVNNL